MYLLLRNLILQIYCEGAYNKMFVVCNNPMLLVLDNSDSPSIVEQLSQGPSLVYNTFISDSS